MDLADAEWRFIAEEARRGPMNMALDEVAAETVGSGGPRTVRVYRWDPSTLSLGYHQASETVDWDYCEQEGIDITRRPTGGGGIYHDVFGDISYSIIVPAAEVPGDLMESYQLLLKPVFDAFDRLEIPAHVAEEAQPALYEPACYLRALNPAHDVVVNGRKISGNAQYRQKDAVIQHGSITYARATDRHLNTFATPGVTPEEFDERVTSIREQTGTDRAKAVETIQQALVDWCQAKSGEWTEPERARGAEISASKFETDDWNYRY